MSYIKRNQESLLNNSLGPKVIADIDSPSQPFKPFNNIKKPYKLSVCQLLKDPSLRKPVYILFILLITYMFNQMDRFLQSITVDDMQDSQHWGNMKDGTHSGTGIQEDMLVGPVFTAVYLPFGIPMAYIADTYPNKKKYILCLSLIVWSLAIVYTGFSTTYYEVVICRFILGIAQSACTPVAGSIITDSFPKSTRTTALGIYNWGIYTGYSLSQGLANILTDDISWRMVWWIFGSAGVLWSFLVITLPRVKTLEDSVSNSVVIINQPLPIPLSKERDINVIQVMDIAMVKRSRPSITRILKHFCSTPSICILFVGSLIRNAAGYIWAYNSTNFYKNVRHQSATEIAVYMQWIPLIGGCLGALFGGFISDRYIKRANVWKRLAILVVSNLVAAPFAVLALILPPPFCYLSLIGSNVFGEMWVGICLALTVGLVPQQMKTTSLSIYFFIIGIAGFSTVLVSPVQNTFFSGGNTGFRNSLLVLFPGLYVVSSVVFLIAMFTLKHDQQKLRMSAKSSISSTN